MSTVYQPDLQALLAKALAQSARIDALKQMQKVSDDATDKLRRALGQDPNAPTIPSDLKHAFGTAVTALAELANLIELQLEEENS